MASEKILVDECNEDLISKLPDDVLCHILSFIPTKFSVRTSVLSTRWKQLFTFVPILDFNDCEPTINTNPSAKFCATSFINFVNSVLASYDVSRINKFKLTLIYYSKFSEYFPVASWVSSVIHRNVQEIKMFSQLYPLLMVPLDIFLCKTLVSLTLRGFELVLPHSVCLPCLRTCELLNVCFDNESARRFLRSCPVLENLTLYALNVKEGVKVLDISVPVLKRLIIFEHRRKGYQLALNAPNLLSFHHSGPLANDFSGLQSLKSLVQASIFDVPTSDSRSNVVVELVRSICHIQHLQLYAKAEACSGHAFVCAGHPLPIFKNLTHLSLASFSCLSDLLDKSPRLESISFDKEFDGNRVEIICLLTERVPACVSLHLKEVSLGFTGLVHERKVIKYFLKYAQNLKKMKIRTKLSWNEHLEISSAACEIVLV